MGLISVFTNFLINLKMSKTITDFKTAMRKRGITPVSEFEGNQRSIDFNGFIEGDSFTVPETFEVYSQKFGRGENANSAQFIYVDVTAKSGEKYVKQLFPSSFNKSVEVYEDTPSGQPLKSTGNRETAEGTAIDKFREFVTVQEGMEQLAGKKLVVSKVKRVTTKRYDRDQLYSSQLLVLDFAK